VLVLNKRVPLQLEKPCGLITPQREDVLLEVLG